MIQRGYSVFLDFYWRRDFNNFSAVARSEWSKTFNPNLKSKLLFIYKTGINKVYVKLNCALNSIIKYHQN
jgi:hypothetical protein